MLASDWLKRLFRAYQTLCDRTLRRPVALEARRRRDFMRLMVLSESLGIPNPANWYCLELMPFLIEDYHRWHRRMGQEHAPPGGFRCC